MTLDILEEMRKVVSALDEGAVDYALVGAFALAIHGAPRATTDIDLLIRPEDVDRALSLVAPLGFSLPAQPMTFPSGVTVQRVSKVDADELLTLDLLLATGPLTEAWESRMSVDALGIRLRVVDRAQLVRMKALAGRLRDLADIERLRGDDDA
ncbi:MAG: hypothetical protein KF718_01290 [Polyangiaceae bacterium]|nr:hypothetical protein [Polyangiaceae bacterium]